MSSSLSKTGTALALCCAMYNCARDDREWTSRDTWYTAPPTELLSESSLRDLPPEYYAPVREEVLGQAELLLTDSSFRSLGPAEVPEFAYFAQPPDEGRPYLLRGVVLNELTGSFSVLWADGTVVVLHVSLGRRPVPMRRRPIVAYLPAEPSQVFVGCSMFQ